MATNGARKAPSAATSEDSANLLDTSTIKAVVKSEKTRIKLKIKKPVPKPSKSGNWKESEAVSMYNNALSLYIGM
ncbi:hypothetical protein PtrSN002B_003465 [Pyrenophora tritici-repentis]|nr:hypothetical protein PtrV1_09048 [Pyrenophora tritici-repentis]KAI1545190.1 hypothetical protein PtrSN001C_003271 [Pyrenophora tritici-repentis]KAI1554964.1 hypothetical protein PtrSN002B_003465 [Pyrenophora tritici-repentis]KAI1573729.1 hypothetical protein PtrEW4_003561 [Pyrenophora tritici-repentis]KAI1583194.1 hypothetical protein PtrEW7m1_003446 [Pyrenophora tritici-repentis]